MNWCPYIFPSNNGSTCNTEYVDDAMHSCHHYPVFFLSDRDIHTVIIWITNIQFPSNSNCTIITFNSERKLTLYQKDKPSHTCNGKTKRKRG